MLESVQRRATKCVPTLRELSYPERLKKLGLPTLTYRRNRGDMIEVFKIFNKYDPAVSPCMKVNENATRGHSLKLSKIRANKDIRKYSFCLRVTDTWNNLPSEVIESNNINQFKSRIDKAWDNTDFKFNYRSLPPGQRNTRVI